MSYLKHPASGDAHLGLWAFARFGDESGNGGGNTDEDPDTFSGFMSGITERDVSRAIAVAAVTAAAPGFGTLAALGEAARGYAEENGIPVEDPTTNDFEGGEEYDTLTDMMAALGGDVDLVLSNDFTKRIDNPTNYANRRRLVDIYRGLQESSEDDRYWVSGDDMEFLRSIDLDRFDGRDGPFGVNSRQGMAAIEDLLRDPDYAPYSVIDRNFGEADGLNRALAQEFDFHGEFQDGEFGEFRVQQDEQTQAEISSFIDDWWGGNRDLNRALALEFDYDGRFREGGFNQHVAEHDIQSEVDSFIDAFNGGGPVDAPTVYGSSGDTAPWTSTTNAGAGNSWGVGLTAPEGGALSSGNFDLSSVLSFPEISIPEIDLSFLDEPADNTVIDAQAQARADALKAQQDRDDILSHVIHLNSPRLRRNIGVSYDIGGTGLNIL